ncbi:MAG: SseB family protein [Planctomycetota bacterium]
MTIDSQLGQILAEAIEDDKLDIVLQKLAEAEIIVLQQIDEETGESVADEHGDVNVVLAEMDEGIAVVCFTDESYADKFSEVFADRIPVTCPRVAVTGGSLLASMPEDCGLLINSGSEHECYLSPAFFEAGEAE